MTPPSNSNPNKPRPQSGPRMMLWLALAVLLSALTYTLAPQQLPLSVYKLSLVAMAGVAGCWIDQAMFPYARPEELYEVEFHAQHVPQMLMLSAALMLRRALIVSATMLAVGLGA